MKTKKLSARLITSILLGLFIVASTSFAQGFGNKTQFAMEMHVESNRGGMGIMSATMKYYAGENRVRMDVDLGAMGSGGGMIVERNGDEVTTIMLVPQMNQYLKTVTTYSEYVDEGEGPVFGSPDDPEHPCQSNPDTTCEKLGSDTFLGRSVVKYRVNDIEEGRPKESLIWFDPELAFAVKVEGDDGTMEAVFIEVGTQPADLFEIPSGWTELQMDF